MPTTSSRLLALLSLLQSRRDWPGDVLADRLDVSTRTVRRDVDRLRELGYRISSYKGPDGGYRLAAGSDLPPMLFDDEQAVALAVSLQLGAASGAGIGEAALRALATVRQVMPSRLRHRIDAIPVSSIEPPSGDRAELDGAVLLALASATHAGEVLRFDYPVASGSSQAPAPPRRVEPHHLVTWRGRWYLVAWDLDRADWRTFRADRITPRTPNGPRFVPRELPGGDLTAFVVGRFRGAEGSADWPCLGEAIVDLPLDAVQPYLADGVAEPVDAGRTRVTVGSWSWPGLVARLLAFDADLEIVGPAPLRDAMQLVAERSSRAALPG